MNEVLLSTAPLRPELSGSLMHNHSTVCGKCISLELENKTCFVIITQYIPPLYIKTFLTIPDQETFHVHYFFI